MVRTLFNEEEGGAIEQMLSEQYQRQDFDMMLKTYKRAMRDYPLTVLGVQAPFRIARLYHQQEKVAQSREALREAVQYYREFPTNHKNAPVELQWQAQELLVSSYLVQSDFSSALRSLGGILINFADTPYLTASKADQIIQLMNRLSLQTKNIDQSKTVYQEFLAVYPDHEAVDVVRAGLEELKDPTF